jgi:hypothetical protein
MIDVATVRPDDWNLPLFIHVLGAFTLVGTLVMAAGYLFAARRDGSLVLTRAGYRSLLLGALPAFIVTRVGAEWIASKEGLDDSDLTWVTLGYLSTDIGLLALIGATVAAGLAMRRARLAEAQGGASRGTAIAAWLVALLIVVYAVMMWLMATKPA